MRHAEARAMQQLSALQRLPNKAIAACLGLGAFLLQEGKQEAWNLPQVQSLPFQPKSWQAA
eukprot:2852676-Amphidinium_carterae.1